MCHIVVCIWLSSATHYEWQVFLASVTYMYMDMYYTVHARTVHVHVHFLGWVHPRKMCSGLALVPICLSHEVHVVMQSIHVCEHYT